MFYFTGRGHNVSGGRVQIAIHQPNYLPWLGYFEKIASCDLFVVLNNVQHVRQSLTRRTRIRHMIGSDQVDLLSIPICRHDQFTPINELAISGTAWVQEHRNKIHSVYRTSPFFAEIEAWISTGLSMATDGMPLAHLNAELIKGVCFLLGIETTIKLASDINTNQSKSALMAEITELCGGIAYYSGGGAGSYTDENDFFARGLAISYQAMGAYCSEVPYPQHQGGAYVPGLSIIDALFNIGVDGVRRCLDGYWKWEQGRPQVFDLSETEALSTC